MDFIDFNKSQVLPWISQAESFVEYIKDTMEAVPNRNNEDIR